MKRQVGTFHTTPRPVPASVRSCHALARLAAVPRRLRHHFRGMAVLDTDGYFGVSSWKNASEETRAFATLMTGVNACCHAPSALQQPLASRGFLDLSHGGSIFLLPIPRCGASACRLRAAPALATVSITLDEE